MASISPPLIRVVAQYPTLRDKPHRTVVYLPMCHVLGRDVAITLPLISQLVPHFGEDPEDFATTMFEVAPDRAFHGAALFAEICLACAGRHSQFEPNQARAIYDVAMRFARDYARRALGRRQRPAAQDALYAVSAAAVFRPILNKLGFD